jgi:hypothetical protein
MRRIGSFLHLGFSLFSPCAKWRAFTNWTRFGYDVILDSEFLKSSHKVSNNRFDETSQAFICTSLAFFCVTAAFLSTHSMPRGDLKCNGMAGFMGTMFSLVSSVSELSLIIMIFCHWLSNVNY